VMRHVMTAIG